MKVLTLVMCVLFCFYANTQPPKRCEEARERSMPSEHAAD